jgi:hypothetical protein
MLMITCTPTRLESVRWWGDRPATETLPQPSRNLTAAHLNTLSNPFQNHLTTASTPFGMEIKKLTTCNKKLDSSELGVHVISKKFRLLHASTSCK